MSQLNSKKRSRLPDRAFAYVDARGRRRLPINDESHVRNALARFNQVAFEDEAARERARIKLLAAAKKYGIVPIGFITGQFKSQASEATAGRLVIELGRVGTPGEFEGRLRAISLAHDILTQLRWGQVDLEHLVERSLAPYGGNARVAWSGPTLRLPAQNVVSLAMVLHELSTNAAKYGAFSNGCGRVEIAWRRLDDGMAELTWSEREGPGLSGEPVPGFGNKLISRVMSYDLQGSAKMRYAPEGLGCRLTFRLPNASWIETEHAEAPLAPVGN